MADEHPGDALPLDAPALDAARCGRYLLLRTRLASGDEHVDLFEVGDGPHHLESFSGNRGLPEAAALSHLASVLGRTPECRWHPVPAEPPAARARRLPR